MSTQIVTRSFTQRRFLDFTLCGLPFSLFLLLGNIVSCWAIPVESEMESISRKEEARSLSIRNFLENIFSTPMMTNAGSVAKGEEDPDGGDEDNSTIFIPQVLISPSSIFPVQFFNNDMEQDNLNAFENETDTIFSSNNNNSSSNSTEDLQIQIPNVIFGSPLCYGLCYSGQYYAENSSVRVLSDRHYSLLPPKRRKNSSTISPPVLAPDEISPTINPIQAQVAPVTSLLTQNRNEQDNPTANENENENGVLSWLSSWIYKVPLPSAPPLTRLPSRIVNRILQIPYQGTLQQYIG